MSVPDAAFLIERIEDFHEVWSDGFTGDPTTVARKLADYNVGSLQTAKRIMKTPMLLREATSKVHAIAYAEEFENCGLKCRIEHVGRRRLDVIAESTIIDTLTVQGSVPLSSVYTDHDAKFIFHTTEDITPIYIDTETDEGVCQYLACLRFLIRRNMLRELDTNVKHTK